jgi:protein-disulfide isomerase
VIRLALALAAVVALPLSSVTAAPEAATKVSPVRDWTRTVVLTPEGGFRMGNPAAPVKLVEYGSLACPHCRHFEETGYKPLVQNYVRTGKVSYEFRNLLLNAPDVSVSLLAHCAGPARFFAMSEAVFAAQPQWEDKLSKLSAADKAAMDNMSDQQRFVRLSELAGFPAIAARFGVSAARGRQCLTDPKGLERLLNITKAAEDAGVTHTPTFLIDGKISDAATWEQLEPRLESALGGRG